MTEAKAIGTGGEPAVAGHLDGSSGRTVREEFARGWPIVLGSNLGVALGVAAIPALAIAVFLRQIEAEFGWSRSEISLGPTIVLAVTALCAPAIGWVVDRVHSSIVCFAGLMGLAASLFLFSLLGPSITTFYIACAMMGLLAAGSATVTYARAVSASFDKARGTALGIAMVGTGISAFVVPMLLTPYAASAGWRQGYVALAIAVAVAAVVVSLLLTRAPRVDTADERREAAKIDLSAVFSQSLFWKMIIAFFLVPMAVGGFGLHLLSFLGDAGVAAAIAGMIAGMKGITQTVSRLFCGWLVDRYFAPKVAAGLIGTAAAAMLVFIIMGPGYAILAPFAIGIALGAEIDLLGYMTARYYGMRAYGRIYGFMYASCLAGSSLSIVFYGLMFDLTGSYIPAMYAGFTMLVIATGLFLALPRYEQAAQLGE